MNTILEFLLAGCVLGAGMAIGEVVAKFMAKATITLIKIVLEKHEKKAGEE